MNHHYLSRISNPWKKKTTNVLWSLNPDGKAIVFIHGFSGSFNTWKGFPEMIADSPGFEGWDIFFVEYDWGDQVELTGRSMFEYVLQPIFENPQSLFKSSSSTVTRPQDFQYKQVVIAAHSLGAVVTRVAMLAASRAKVAWLPNTKMVLYAPAHNGANIVSLGSEALGVFGAIGKMLPNVLKVKYPSLIDLESVPGVGKSDLLKRIESDTKALLDAGKGDFTKAQAVLYGGDDRVVVAAQFCQDTDFKSVPNISHTAICKPSNTFDRPFTMLSQCSLT